MESLIRLDHLAACIDHQCFSGIRKIVLSARYIHGFDSYRFGSSWIQRIGNNHEQNDGYNPICFIRTIVDGDNKLQCQWHIFHWDAKKDRAKEIKLPLNGHKRSSPNWLDERYQLGNKRRMSYVREIARKDRRMDLNYVDKGDTYPLSVNRVIEPQATWGIRGLQFKAGHSRPISGNI